MMKFYNICRTYSSVYTGHKCSFISNEACVIQKKLTQDVLF